MYNNPMGAQIMKFFFPLVFVLLGCAHQTPEVTRGPSSNSIFHSLNAQGLVDHCKGMFKQPRPNTSRDIRRLCEMTFKKSEFESCSVRLLSSDNEFAKLGSNTRDFEPLNKNESLVTNTNVAESKVRTYEFQLSKMYASPSSGALISIKCDIKNLNKWPRDFIASFEQRAPSITENTVFINNSVVPVEYEVIPTAQ
jgi:hypothetical protein